MKTNILIAILPLLFAVGAHAAPSQPSAPQPQIAVCYAATPQPTASAITLRASTNATRYTPGQAISVRIVAANTSKKAVTLSFASGQRFDFSVFKIGSNEPAYTWSANKMFAQIVGSLTLRAGQKQSFDASIGDEMGAFQPGKYRLIARLSNSGRPITAPPVAFEIANSGISLKARTDKSSYKVGEPVQIDATATNSLSRASTLRFGSGLGCDFVISDESGKELWTYGANLRFIRVLGDVTWAPREAKTYSATWDGVALPGELPTEPLKPGRYKVQAVLRSTPEVLAPAVWIDITS